VTSSHDMDGMKAIPDLDRETTERMLAGLIEPDDAPPGYAEVTRVLRTAAAPPERTSPTREAWAIAVAHQALDDERTLRSARTGRPSMRSRYVRAKVIGVLTVGTLLGTSGMAMAGVLPAPVQDAAAKVLAKAGITIPAGHPASTGSTISQVATSTSSVGVAKGQEISTIASGGKSEAGLHGKPSWTPNGGGTGAGDDASDGAGDHGSSTASAHSQGHSAAGSENASSHAPSH
jgi:hypothetical protein